MQFLVLHSQSNAFPVLHLICTIHCLFEIMRNLYDEFDYHNELFYSSVKAPRAATSIRNPSTTHSPCVDAPLMPSLLTTTRLTRVHGEKRLTPSVGFRVPELSCSHCTTTDLSTSFHQNCEPAQFRWHCVGSSRSELRGLLASGLLSRIDKVDKRMILRRFALRHNSQRLYCRDIHAERSLHIPSLQGLIYWSTRFISTHSFTHSPLIIKLSFTNRLLPALSP